MTLDCYRQLAQALQQNPTVLATVTAIKGSVPREVGAKMMICANGQTLNTIGGGAGEAKVIQQAKTVLETGEKQFVEIDLTGTSQRETQGICGGTMQVWLELWSGNEAIALIQQIIDSLASGQTITLITPFDRDRSPYLSPHPPDPLPSHAFVETLQPPPTLFIIGAGHVGEQLAKVASFIGFQVVIQDDRPEWANCQRYPQAARIFTESIANAIAQLTPHAQLYIALVTRNYKYDLEALTILLQPDTPFTYQYLGMIGSKKRIQQVYQILEARGISPSQLSGIHAPIGLEIGALTPEEIAISICAELIQVRRQTPSLTNMK